MEKEIKKLEDKNEKIMNNSALDFSKHGKMSGLKPQ